MKSVLLLGSGLCAPPIVQYLLAHDIRLVVATRTKARAEKLLQGHANGKAVEMDITKEGAMDILDKEVQEVDLVISLLPYIYHVAAAKVALKYKKHFCTTSYISEEMEQLDQIAKDAGVIMINECGVDPGLDHMSAQRVIDRVHAEKGLVIDFYSVCGGLPAPASNNNPLGYKCSWSPRGVLLASRNSAVFLENGEKKSVNGVDLYSESHYKKDNVDPVGDLEWYANRDSVKYIDIYGIPEVQTIIRGTYRYPGWCRAMRKVALHGLTSLDKSDIGGKTFAEFTRGVFKLDSTDNLRENVAKCLEVDASDDILHRLEWLGLFSDRKIPENIDAPIDAVSFLFEDRMQYAEGEKDMIVMKHTFEVEYPNGSRRQITSTLIDEGLQPIGDSSMSRTVSLPLAIAVRGVLEGRITLTGIQRPITPELYNVILDEMEKEHNVKFVDTVQPIHIHLRHEVKINERRTPLTPANVSELLKNGGFRVSVERSSTRCYKDEEYEKAGATLVETGSWTQATRSTIILGLKELPESTDPIRQTHVYFAHCFKGQDGAAELLTRFSTGGGAIHDIEFLVHENGRRVAAFGHPAGVMGMALGLLHWARKENGSELAGPVSPWESYESLVKDVKEALATVDRAPKVYVLGALGRAGSGSVQLAKDAGLKCVEWDIEETKVGGPFPELAQADVLVNCIYLSSKIPPFVNMELLEKEHNLSVVVDVSCDTTNPNNPLPIYSSNTTMAKPVDAVKTADGKHVCDVIAVDYLPTLLPLSSSDSFTADFFPHILALNSGDRSVWDRAHNLYVQKTIEVLKK